MVGAGDVGRLPRSAASSFSAQRRGARRTAAVVDEDDRRACARGSARAARGRSRARSSARRRPRRRSVEPSGVERRSARLVRLAPCPRPGRRSRGRAACARPASTIAHGRAAAPTRKRATSSSGRCVADSPIRCGRVPARARSRSSVSARCAPRLVAATAWISSTITALDAAQHLARLRGQHQVERLGRRDQDVRRRAQHRARARAAACRRCGWRPIAELLGAPGSMPRSGARRLRSMS